MENTQLITLSNQLASHFNLGDGKGLMDTLKSTAFKGNVSDDQMTALLIVANQYKLNPWTKEIYAFPDRQNGIVPIVGVDGWSRIINSHPQFDGMEFEQDAESCTCKIYRKDRTHPICVTEWLEECKRENTLPWKSHPKRMLRHKAMIQCARLAFGFVGIYDQDEAERIHESQQGINSKNNVFSGNTNDPQRDELINIAKSHAQKGLEEYQSYWKGLSAEQRKIIGVDEHNRLKDIASGIINAEFKEVEHGAADTGMA